MGTVVLVTTVVLITIIFLVRHFSPPRVDIEPQSLNLTESEAPEESQLTCEHPVAEPKPAALAIKSTVDLSLVPKEFVVLDLETTGLSPEMNEIIEIGAIRVNRDGDRHPAFQALVKPMERIPRKITQITGITQSMVDRDGLPLSEVLIKFKEFIGDLPIVSFNAAFDMGFIWMAARSHSVPINNRYACVLKMARRAYPGLPSYRLVDLAKQGKLSDENTHRALGDCQRTIPVFTASVTKIGERIVWDVPRVDSRVAAKHSAERNSNRAFVEETRALETTDPKLAVMGYREAMTRMYEYEKLIYSCRGDDQILDRLTLVLGKLGRYEEVVNAVDEFVTRFPDAQSNVMTGILKRKEKAERKLELGSGVTIQ